MDFSWLPAFLESLLMSADQFLLLIKGFVYQDALGSVPVLGGVNAILLASFISLSFAAMFHVAHLYVEWIKWMRLNERRLMEIFKVVIFVVLMAFFKPWSTIQVDSNGKINTGAIAGVDYKKISDNIHVGSGQAMAAVSAVEVVARYQELLQQKNQARREKILEVIAEDPNSGNLKAMIALQKEYSAKDKQGSEKTSWSQKLITEIRRAGSLITVGVKQIYQSVMNGESSLVVDMVKIWGKSLTNAITYYFFLVITWLAYGFFVLGLMKALFIFAFYLKLAAFMGMIFIAPAVGLAYFLPLRGFAIALIRNIVIIMILAQAYTACFQAVFSSDNIQYAMALVMKEQLKDTPPTPEEILAMKIDLTYSTWNRTSVEDPDALTSYVTMSPAMARETASQIARIVLALSLMTMILGKLYEVIAGALDGGYDPTELLRQQAQEAAQAARR